MKYKKIMLVSIFLLAILTIGAVSASGDSEELTVDDGDGNLIASPIKNVDLLSDDDGDDEAELDDVDGGNGTSWEGPIVVSDNGTSWNDPDEDEGDDEDDPYQVQLEEAFDLNNPDTEIIKIHCPDGTEGYFVFIADFGQEGETLLKYSYEIKQSDNDRDIYVKASDLNITEAGGYGIFIYLTDDPDNLEDCQIYESWGGIEAIDYAQFRVIELDTFEPIELFTGNIFAVYCPEGSEGNITVTVRQGDEEEPFITSVKPVLDMDDSNNLYWTLPELNMDHKGEYFINVFHDEDELQRGMRVEVASPIRFSPVSYLNSTRNTLLYVELPSDITEATLILNVNGEKAFEKSLKDFINGENGTYAPYWIFKQGYREVDENYKQYYVGNSHLDYELHAIDLEDEDYYSMSATLNIDGRDSISNDADVNVVNSMFIANDRISIEVFDSAGYHIEDELEVMIINTFDDCDGSILITVTDNDWSWEGSPYELRGGDGEYYVLPEFFNDLGDGNYEINIAYVEDGEKVIETMAYIEFYGGEGGDDERSPIVFNDAEIYTDSESPDYRENEWIAQIYFDEPTAGRFVLSNNLITLFDIELPGDNENGDWLVEGEDGASYYEVHLDDLNLTGLSDGDWLEFIFYNEGDDEPRYTKHVDVEVAEDYFRFNGENEWGDDPIDDVEFRPPYSDEEFEIGDNVEVAYLYVPDSMDDFNTNLYVFYGDELIYSKNTADIEAEHDDEKQARKYPIALDLTQLEDKTLISFTCDYFGDDVFWAEAVQVNGDKIIFWDDPDFERLEFYSFYGNLTTGTLNDPELMGPNTNGMVMSITISDYYNITDGTFTISDGDNVLFTKKLSEIDDKEYDYSSLGYSYIINSAHFDLMTLPENNVTFTFTSGNISITQKRLRIDDYLYKVLTPDDFSMLSFSSYKFEIAEDAILTKDDDAIVLFGNSNMQSIYIDFGGGIFNVYVNDTKVEGLGYVLYEAWKNSDAYVEEYDYPSDWGSDLSLARLRGGSVSLSEFHMSLADLGITESGTYNIRITHYPDVDEMEEAYIYAAETELVNQNVVYVPDYAGVEILTERVYKNGQPFLFTFKLGENVRSESNRILVYLNGDLAFNGTTLFWEENDDGEMELVDLWELNDGQLNEYPLNEYGVLDVGEYEAVVYLVKGDAAPVEIGSGNFTVRTQKGNMNFEMGSSEEDDGVHTVLYVDIPEGNWDEYSLSINIADSEETYPDEEYWFSRWYDEYVIFKDDEIYFKDSLDNIIGKGQVAIDLGVLDDETHIWVVYGNGEETVFNGGDFYQNDFKVNNAVEKPGEIALVNDITFDYNESGSANVTLVGAKNITANVVGHDEAIVNFDNGILTVSGLDAGEYTLNITTVPEEGFTAVNKLVNITVNKIDANMAVEAEDISAGEEESITIKVFGFGTVIVQFNGMNYALQVVDGVAILNIPVDVPGTYNVTASVEGDKNINPTQVTKSFNVAKLTPEIIITPGEAIEGSDLEVAVEIANATGNVVVNTEEIALVNGKANATIKDLAAGNLTVNVVYSGDNKFLNASESINVVVKAKEDAGLTVSAENIEFGQTATVNIEINSDVTGKVTIDGNDVVISNGKGTYSISNLTAGEYTVIAVFAGDKYFNADEKNATFKVSKLTPEIIITPGEAIEGSDLDVAVEIAGANGSVVVNTEEFSLVDGKANATIKDLTAGNLTVNVIYPGDNKFLNASESVNVVVKAKEDAGLTVSAENIEFGQTATVNIEINSDVTGKVTVDGNDVAIANGKGTYTISDLAAGEYTLTAKFEGDKYFNADEKNVTFKVTKVDSSVSVDDLTFDYGASGSATVNLTGATAIEVKIINSTAVPVVDGNKITVSGLDAGTYTLEVTTVPDANHNAVTKTATITVNKIKSAFDVTGDVTFTYKESGSTGVVNLTGAESVEAIVVNHTEATVKTEGNTITVSNLDVGTYTLAITTVPGANYYAVTKTVSVEVTPIIPVNPTLSIAPVSDVEKGSDVTISISALGNFTGSVKVSVDGNEIGVADVVNGTGSFIISAGNLAVGTNTVKVSSEASEYFTAGENTAAVTVIVKDLPKTVTKDTLSNYFDKNGVYIADLDEIILTGEFSGIALTFNKAVSVTAQDATFTNAVFNINGDNVAISSLKISNDLTDYAITVNGANKVSLIGNDINALNGILISNGADFIVDSNTIVSPVGESVCGILINGTGSGVVKNNRLDLKSTKTAYAINTNPTGPLKVSYINNTIEAESYFAVGIYDDSEIIKDNKISLSGNYAIGIVVLSNAEVEGNEIILDTSNTGSEDVEDPIGVETAGIKVNNDATITNNNIESTAKSIAVVGGSSTISDNTLTGQVSVESNGNTISNNVISTTEEYAVDLGSSTGNSIGSNEMYSSSGNGNDAVKASADNAVADNFQKFDPAMTVSVADIYEGSNAVIAITTNNTFSGDVSVRIGDKTYTVSVTKGTGSVQVSGLAVGTYAASASFRATDVFTESVKNATFAVKAKVATEIKATAVTTTYATSKNIVITLTDADGNPIEGKNVTVVLNGAEKVLPTNENGQVSYAIGTKLLVKTYYATITFDGDAKYVKSTGSAKVVVNKAKPKITAKNKSFKVKKTKKYTIVLKTDKNKVMKKVKVTIKVKGKTYTAKTNSKGKATFTLKKLTKTGKFKATVKYAGNKYYKAVTKSVTITVKK